jgi:MFS transporter, PHS family, inorganic phosphate transporter
MAINADPSANSLFAPEILVLFNVASNDLNRTVLFTLLIALMGLPGYYVAAFTVDKIGRKRLQVVGFLLVAALSVAVYFAFDFMTSTPPLFLATYGLIFFFYQFGPNTTTFLIPSEVFPTVVRARCHGVSAAMGKVGAAIGVAMMEPIKSQAGVATVFLVCGAVSLLGALVTVAFVPQGAKTLAEEDDKFRNALLTDGSDKLLSAQP